MMYIDYAKLWKLLIDKSMTKTDLLALTGISSRVLSKLSKNQTVNTDTIAKICTALNCDVSDMMECVADEKMTLYHRYKKLGKVMDETELYKTVVFSENDRKYIVYASKKAATKATHIHCKSDKTVYWEQLYIGGVAQPQREEYVLVRPKGKPNEKVIVLIKGKPAIITGLDDNGFVSARGIPKRDSDVYVMTEAEFKVFKQQ